MIDMLMGLILGLVLFLCVIKGYCLGLKHGKQLSNGIVPKLELNPIKHFTEAIETHKQSKEEIKIKNDLDDVMGATRESMLNSIKAR